MPGLFITLEGGDGVGKSTQAALLAEWLERDGHEVVRTREPGGTALGAEIRRLLLHGGDAIGEVDPRAEALLYAADRAQHIATVVRPALEHGAVVVQDRYIDSSLAYQGAGRVLDVEDVRRFNEWAVDGLWPHLTVLLDLAPAQAASRRESRDSLDGTTADRLEAETVEFHAAVRHGFRILAESDPGRFLVLDASDDAATIHESIRQRVTELLK